MLRVKPIGPTVASYYLNQGEGRWVGRGTSLLGLEGSVERAALSSVLRGQHPTEQRFLPERQLSRRRSGWDLVLAAPKSLSLLAAARPEFRAEVAGAQRDAVAEALGHFEEHQLRINRSSAPGGKVPGCGAVAASFDHQFNAGGEPHVHTHLLVANLVRDEAGKWCSVSSWWTRRRELDAIYRLGLRHHLAERGLDLRWHLRPDGLVDLASVPRAAVRAASTRTHEALTGARYSGRSISPTRDWKRAALAGGLTSSTAIAADPAGDPDNAGVARAVTARLALRGSTFTRQDVLTTLAGCPEARFTAETAREWTDRYLSGCEYVTSEVGRERWTSTLARSADSALESALERRQRNGVTAQPGVEQLLGGAAAISLAAQPGQSGFLAHVETIRTQLPGWHSEAMRVAVAARTPHDALRWAVLAGLEPFQAARRPDILVIDQADRRTSGEMMVLLTSAPDARVIFVEGGTAPRARVATSLAFEHFLSSGARANPMAAPQWNVGTCSNTNQLAPANRLLDCWAARVQQRTPALLVGLGYPETLELAAGARRHLSALGLLEGPELRAAGRAFSAGERVVALRPLGPRLPAGSLGTVQGVDLRRGVAEIKWPDRTSEADRAALRRVGHAYAATPRLAARIEAPAYVLGPSEGLGLDRSQVMESVNTPVDSAKTGRCLTGGRTYGPDAWPVQR